MADHIGKITAEKGGAVGIQTPETLSHWGSWNRFRAAAVRTPIIATLLLGWAWVLVAEQRAQSGGTYTKWSKVELELNGPQMEGMGTPNPFLMDVMVSFTGPGGQTVEVPGFYDGDGQGGMDGDVWRVRFRPGEAGTWSWVSASGQPQLDGQAGLFEVVENAGCQAQTADGLPNFGCVGRLEWVGEHYLKYADGGYWLKGGANEPEDLLAAEASAGFNSDEEAIDYLAGIGVNSVYVMTNNVQGDRKNVWPWVGATQTEAMANDERFDVGKLAAWEAFLEYIQGKGLVVHLVLEDDSGWTGFNRGLYYREMIARFGHHNGLYWDLTEEYGENYTADEVKGFAQLFSGLDGHGRPLTVHQVGALFHWEPFLGDANFDLTSFQTGDVPQNAAAVEWWWKVEASGRTIPVSFDESTRNLFPEDRALFRHIVWSEYLGGANVELYTRLSGGLGYQDYGAIFGDLVRARELLEGVGYWGMQPENDLLVSGTGYVFAQVGEAYLVYLPTGGAMSLDLSGTGGQYSGMWVNPRTGAQQGLGPVTGGGVAGFTAPDGQDWVLRLVRSGSGATPTPTPTLLTQTPTASASLTFSPSPTLAPTSTSTPTPSATYTPVASPPALATRTPSWTSTMALTDTPSATATPAARLIYLPYIARLTP